LGTTTRSSGKLYRVCFGNESQAPTPWIHKSIDSRDCSLPNKELIAEWIATYGEDSDFVRVRVRGLPPAADELQFIDRLPEASIFPIFLRATMPQVQSPDTGEG
jgi:hypothetical protein